jgi:hypothetical protein
LWWLTKSAFFASKTLLGNDDGIDAALVKLGRLTDEQNSTLAALSYELELQTSDALTKIATFLGSKSTSGPISSCTAYSPCPQLMRLTVK